jgi:CheY-like chemotaxis protein
MDRDRGLVSACVACRADVMATVLVVEDDPLIAMTAADMIKDIGHEVIEAPSGERALAVLSSRERIDLLMTDHAMPGMSGVELARAARRLIPNLPILIATGYPDLPEARDLNVRCVFKPYIQEQLSTEIAGLLADERR